MKRGTSFILPIQVDIDLDMVESIEFMFKQGKRELAFAYPSDNAKREDETNVIELVWTRENTYIFEAKKLEMDTRITVKDSVYNPETPIVQFEMNRTLFKEVMSND